MGMSKIIKILIKKYSFLEILLSPSYITSGGIYRNVKKYSSKINGDVLDFGCGTKPYLNLLVFLSKEGNENKRIYYSVVLMYSSNLTGCVSRNV